MMLLPTGLTILIIQHFTFSVYAGKVKVNNNPQVRVTTSLVNFDARIMDQWSKGGGPEWVISNDSSYPFVGRSFGGALRGAIMGTNMYGSGYPYGADDNSTMANRDFPFGVWPLYWGGNFFGSDEYGPQLDGLRPGGQLVTIPIKAQPGYWNTTDGEIYYAVGDRDSSLGIMVSYVTWCHAAPAWPTKFVPTSTNTTVKVENVIQYYRASSFALSSPNYNNTAALHPPLGGGIASTPVPDSIRYSQFFQCLDGVTQNALMIMNTAPPKPTSLGVTLGIIFGILGIPIIIFLIWAYGMLVVFYHGAKTKWQRRAEARRLAAERRNAGLSYENYP